MRLKRFSLVQRVFHALLMLSFLFQAFSGIGLLTRNTAWGRSVVRLFGGQEYALLWHEYVGFFMLALFILHLVYILVVFDWKSFPRSLAGPDSMIPRLTDLKQFFLHLGWMLGLNAEPEFDRWTYWEKFDYWAVFWGMVVIGLTGLILAFPLYASGLMPGWMINISLWIHRIEALLAIAHVFIIHFFIAHLRRRSFPMDRAMMQGNVDLEHAKEERPSWTRRLTAEGRLQDQTAQDAPPVVRVGSYVFGLALVAFGVYVLIMGILNAPYALW